MEDIRLGNKALWVWGITLILLAVIATVIFTGLRIVQVRANTEINQNSQGYIETKQTLLINLMAEYYSLDSDKARLDESDQQVRESIQAQQRALIIRMHQEADLLGGESTPPEVAEFLRAHPLH